MFGIAPIELVALLFTVAGITFAVGLFIRVMMRA
jgi:hypothetical protein